MQLPHGIPAAKIGSGHSEGRCEASVRKADFFLTGLQAPQIREVLDRSWPVRYPRHDLASCRRNAVCPATAAGNSY